MSNPNPPEFLPFGEASLFSALSDASCSSADVARQPRPQYLYRYLNELGARTIIVESEYTDRDYLDDYANYYVRCFELYKRQCKRLHFFALDISADQLLSVLVKGGDPGRLVENYLGFVVARPLPYAVIGRTVLRTYPDDGGRRSYPCTKTYTANLYGLDLSCTSLAFQEQDTVLAACATVALWCCFQKTADLFETRTPTPAEITQAANTNIHYGRPIPSRGLMVQQICTAIRHVGLEPELFEVNEDTALSSLMYAYARMQLPVILGVDVEGVGGHALAVCGFSRRPDRALRQEIAGSEFCIPMTGLRIDEFYAHDDQIGPFSRLVVHPSASSGERVLPIWFDGSWQDATTGQFRRLLPTVVIVPVYNKIRVTFTDIQEWLTRVHGALSLVLPTDEMIEWDVFLTTSNEMKRELRQEVSEDTVRHEAVLLRPHPRFVWRSVLRVGGTDVLELLADATGIGHAMPMYWVFWKDDVVRSRLAKHVRTSTLEGTLRSMLGERLYDFLLVWTKSPSPPPA